ncbi:MAG: hypothetical protein ACERKO_05195 [Acetanaerobacterium sp.]
MKIGMHSIAKACAYCSANAADAVGGKIISCDFFMQLRLQCAARSLLTRQIKCGKNGVDMAVIHLPQLWQRLRGAVGIAHIKEVDDTVKVDVKHADCPAAPLDASADSVVPHVDGRDCRCVGTLSIDEQLLNEGVFVDVSDEKKKLV